MARKSKKANKLKKEVQKARDAIALRSQQYMPGKSIILRDNPNPVKMSDVLEEFADPLWEEAMPPHAYHKLLSMATVGWNIALLPEEQRDDYIKNFLKQVKEEFSSDTVDLLHYFIERKETHYKEIKRMIVDFEIARLDNKVQHLTVASVPFEPVNK